MNRYLIPVCVFAGLVVLLAIGLTLEPSRVPSPFIDRPVPAFTLPRLLEPEQTIGPADLRGEIALLNVWASWCVACRYEHPLLVRLARDHGVRIYGLNYKDGREDALRWLEEMGDPYAASAFDADGRVGIDLGVYGVPETFVLDRDGIIRHKQIGPLTEELVRDTLLPLLDTLRGGQPAGAN